MCVRLAADIRTRRKAIPAEMHPSADSVVRCRGWQAECRTVGCHQLTEPWRRHPIASLDEPFRAVPGTSKLQMPDDSVSAIIIHTLPFASVIRLLRCNSDYHERVLFDVACLRHEVSKTG